MAKEKTLACIGLNGFDKARIRLLLAEAGDRLRMQWSIGAPAQADLIVVAPDSLEGEAAALRARGRGVRCVNLGAPGDVGEDFLSDGFGVEDLVRVLNAASPESDGQFDPMDNLSPEFFGATEPQAEPAQEHGLPEAVDLERYLRRESGEYAIDKLVPFTIDERTRIQPIEQGQSSRRAQTRSTEREPFAKPAAPGAPGVINTNTGETGQHTQQGLVFAAEGKPLSHYLADANLMAPCQLVLEDAEPLILDPKNKRYMISGDLKAAEPYARAVFAPSSFERLTTRELERWRAVCEPMPYLRLHWLIALRTGDDWLPRHLDPGGSYRIRDMLELDEHFDEQIRISETLKEWRRLHEVAAQAAVDMQAVFNTVAAFDAIGWLEWKPRERRR